MSEIKVDKISPESGTAFTIGDSGDTFTVPSGATIVNSGTATGFGGGLCLQVLGTLKTDTETYSTASWAAVPDMTLAITPTKTSSRILLTISASFGMRDLGAAAKVQFDIASGGYNDLLVGDADGSRTRATWGLRAAGSGGTTHGDYTSWDKSVSYLHTPSYTEGQEITYKLYWNATSGNTLFLNRLYDNGDDANYPRQCSMMTVMEID